jgi:putative transcriptional regulator
MSGGSHSGVHLAQRTIALATPGRDGEAMRPWWWSGFRMHRAAAGYSQQELADVVSVSRQTVGSIERGDSLPCVTLAIALAHALGTTVEELFSTKALR